MSIRSVTALAVARDSAPRGKAAGGGGGAAAVGGPAGDGGGAGGGTDIPQSFVDVLVSAIPTEPLAAYTAIVGIAAGTIPTTDTKHPPYMAFRWATFGVFLALILVAIVLGYKRKAGIRKRFPVAESGAALIAGAAWGLAMPGSALNVQLAGTARTLTTASIAIGAAAILVLVFGPVLKSGTTKTGSDGQRAAPPLPNGQPGWQNARTGGRQ